jgi:hypothetical protein
VQVVGPLRELKMIKRLSFGVVTLALSMACGSSPTSPTPVATPPAPTPPVASAAKVVSVTIRASRDVLYFPETAVLFADAHWDDGSIMPITPEWESSSSLVTLLPNGPVALAISHGAGSAVITARAAGLSATQTITINPGYRPRP